MLNGEKLSERLGGIYVLQKLARDHPSEYHVEVMRLFCAFLHERRSLRRTVHDEETGEVRKISPLGQSDDEGFSILVEDEQAILDAFNSRVGAQIAVEDADDYSLKLAELDFRKVRLEAFRFFNMDVSGTDFCGALLAGSETREANFQDTIMSEAILDGSVFAVPANWDACSTPAPLILDGASLFDVGLEGAYLSGAKLNGANLELASLADARLQGADLTGANLSGTIVDGATFSENSAHYRHPAIGLTQQQLDGTNSSARQTSVP